MEAKRASGYWAWVGGGASVSVCTGRGGAGRGKSPVMDGVMGAQCVDVLSTTERYLKMTKMMTYATYTVPEL